MKKYKILIYGIPFGLLLSFLYSGYVYYTNPDWGDLASIASFIVVFPAIVLLTIVIQIIYLLLQKKRR